MAGFEVKVLNALENNKKLTLQVPAEFSYLKKYYQPNKSPFCLFSHYYHFGLTYPEIEAQIRDFKPDIVGISANFSAYFDCAYKVAQSIKRVNKNITVVFGGRVSTVMPEFVLGHKDIDFALRGEAEFSFLALCRSLSRAKLLKIAGACYKTKNKKHIATQAVLIKNLDALPIPKRILINYANYKFKGIISTALVASRGCNLGCSFCAIGERLRYRSARNIIEEMRNCFALSIRHFNFEDDNINLSPEFGKLLDLIIENFSGKIKISFMNGLLTKGLKPSMCQRLIKAGLTHIDLALVSARPALRHYAKRNEAIKDIAKVSDFMAKHKIPATVHFIVSLPYQKIRDCLADIGFLAKRRLFLGPSIFYPVIESAFFKELKEKFAVKVNDYAFFRSSCAYFDRFMQRDEIFSVFYLSRSINFIKELIDKFSLKTNNFQAFLKRSTKKYNIINNILISTEKIDRLNLGIIILAKLCQENKVFRVEESQKEGRFYYIFKEESFMGPGVFKKILFLLEISGVFSRATIKIKKGAF
jgi:radical SAM superfamily enzyme YgiQ (UPF0313 family)